MRRYFFIFTFFSILSTLHAQTPLGRSFGFGVILGDPTGLTAKFAMSHKTDLSLSAGSSYFGSPRFGIDYTWRFYSFHDAPIHLYAGPGVAVGLGTGNGWFYSNASRKFYYRSSGEAGVGVRGIFGANINLRNDPIEFFFELGPIVGLTPTFGSTVEVGLGVRFYP